MALGSLITQLVWILTFTLPWGPMVMEERLSPPIPFLLGVFSFHLVTLPAAQGVGVVSREGRLVFCLSFQAGS